MPILKTIFLREETGSERASQDTIPTISHDTVYPDTIYVHSASGLGRVYVRPAIDGAIHGETEGDQSEVSNVILTDG